MPKVHRGSNVLNDAMSPQMEAAHISIIPVWMAGISRGAEHIGRDSMRLSREWLKRENASKHFDCTHWCEPSEYLDIVAQKLVKVVVY